MSNILLPNENDVSVVIKMHRSRPVQRILRVRSNRNINIKHFNKDLISGIERRPLLVKIPGMIVNTGERGSAGVSDYRAGQWRQSSLTSTTRHVSPKNGKGARTSIIGVDGSLSLVSFLFSSFHLPALLLFCSYILTYLHKLSWQSRRWHPNP
jgi:hypothetical protein